MRLQTTVLIVGILVLLASGAFAAAQAKPGGKSGQFPAPPAAARVWRSQTTGKEYRVWIENERLHAEWVNIPPKLTQRGAYIQTECRHVGARWIGTSRSYLPCEATEKGKQITNWCPVTTKIEFEHVGTNRMSGKAEGLRRFDCGACKVLETVWKEFEWAPKGQAAVGGKQ